MKRWWMLITIFAFMVVGGAMPAQDVAAARSWPVVRRGDTGENVCTVQAFLIQRGYSMTWDCDFGPTTESKVKSFQSANGLSSDGIVGTNTWEKLVVVARRGDNNIVVKALQRQLNRYGNSLTVDGAFGSGTETAVRNFQSSRGLGADGIAGADTWAALTGGSAGGGGSRASLAQQILNNGRISLARSHPSGVTDNAYPYNNIRDTANGGAASRSCYGNAPCGSVYLQTSLLNGMLRLAESYTYHVTSIAGASHGVNSRHYAGVAVDVGIINGRGVSSSHPNQSAFRSRCSALGATEVLGPGNAGHSTHIHCAWPRP